MRVNVSVVVVCVLQLVSAELYAQQPTEKQMRVAVKKILADSRCPVPVTFVQGGPANRKKTEQQVEPELLFVIRDQVKRLVFEVTSNQQTGEVKQWMRLSSGEPPITNADADTVATVLQAHVPWQNSLKRRGVDASEVVLDVWPSAIPRDAFGFRGARVVAYKRSSNSELSMLQPLEGLAATVNLDARRVLEFYDRDDAPIPNAAAIEKKIDAEFSGLVNASAFSTKPIRTRVTSVPVRGGEVRWNGFTFTPMLHPQDGLVLYDVAFTAGATSRAIAHRLSVSELLTTTTSTKAQWAWRQPLIVGEYGLGAHVVNQIPGTHIAAKTTTVSACTLSANGDVTNIQNAIIIAELDVLHDVSRTALPLHTSNLIVQSTYVVAQRTIVHRYVLSSSGAIDIEVWIGGSPRVQAVADTLTDYDVDGQQTHGTLVAPNALVPIQQYACSFRLDLDVDGVQNTVEEIEFRKPTFSADPYNQSVQRDVYPLYNEQEGQRTSNDQLHRYWKVASNTKNLVGEFTGYSIHPTSSPLLLGEQHALRNRVPFLQNTLWVTRYRATELYASGAFVNQVVKVGGLNDYAANKEPLRDRDVVLWYTQAQTFIPRVEDWPIAEPVKLSVRLVPDGFFHVKLPD